MVYTSPTSVDRQNDKKLSSFGVLYFQINPYVYTIDPYDKAVPPPKIRVFFAFSSLSLSSVQHAITTHLSHVECKLFADHTLEDQLEDA